MDHNYLLFGPSASCYCCLGTGFQVGFGAKPVTIECDCRYFCDTHERNCVPEEEAA